MFLSKLNGSLVYELTVSVEVEIERFKFVRHKVVNVEIEKDLDICFISISFDNKHISNVLSGFNSENLFSLIASLLFKTLNMKRFLVSG
jgi:hypothetical protein